MAEPRIGAKRTIEVFSAGCITCEMTINALKETIGPEHELIVHDMRDEKVAERARAYGLRTVPTVAVDGQVLACCQNTGPTLKELFGRGVVKGRDLPLLNE